MVDNHYDVIVIGSGPGGGSLAHRLAPTGKRILMLERGEYLPRSRANWDAKTVFVDGAYQATDTWYGKDGESFRPGLHYWVGGNSKVYGSALFRLRERDFGALQHTDGVSPAWPLGYDVFEPYYGQAEALFHVHGKRGEDPTEPWSSTPYAFAPVCHEPRIQALNDSLAGDGLHPFHLPLGILMDEKDGKVTPTSPCIRCDAFDGFPCAINAKADAQVICVDPTLKRHDNFALLTGAYVSRLETDAGAGTVAKVHVTRNGAQEEYSADIVVVACGALSSALLLLRSANDKHPTGLANGSDQVGRNYMRHNMSILMALLKEPNRTVFQKTLAVSDFYFGSDDFDYPLGLIQMCAASHGEQIRGRGGSVLSAMVAGDAVRQAVRVFDELLAAERGSAARRRIGSRTTETRLSWRSPRATELAARGLKRKLESLLGVIGAHPVLLERSLYLGKDIPISGTAHQAGTCRFGTNPQTSVLDLDCKAHQVDNLYVTDASFFPSIGAVNPTLTIIANALRVADHIKTRLGA